MGRSPSDNTKPTPLTLGNSNGNSNILSNSNGNSNNGSASRRRSNKYCHSMAFNETVAVVRVMQERRRATAAVAQH